MSPGLAGATRQQLPQLKSIFANLGAIKSVTFKRVEKNGADVYDIDFFSRGGFALLSKYGHTDAKPNEKEGQPSGNR